MPDTPTTHVRRSERPPRRRRYELHPPTVLYITVTLFLAIGAINSQNNLLFWAFGLAVAGVLVSGVVSALMLEGVDLARPPFAPGRAGEPIRIRYVVSNRNRFVPCLALQITERFRPATNAPIAATAVTHLPPRSSTAAISRPTPLARGCYRSPGVAVTTTFPFGLLKKTVFFLLPDTLEIGPAAIPLRRDLLRPIASRTDTAARSLSQIGSGDEFFGLREYLPGDPTRLIAWRASARSDQLVLRQNTAPAPPRVMISLDAPPPDRSAYEVERAIALAVSVYESELATGLAAGLMIDWAGIDRPPSVHARIDEPLLRALAHLKLNRLRRHAAVSVASLAPHQAAVRVTYGPEFSAKATGPGNLAIDLTKPTSWRDPAAPPEPDPPRPRLVDRLSDGVASARRAMDERSTGDHTESGEPAATPIKAAPAR